MDFIVIALQMVEVSLPILLGWALFKLDILNDVFDSGISRLVMNVALPCSILASIDGASSLPDASILVMLMLATCVAYVVGLAVAYVLTALLQVPVEARAAYRFAITFGNCGFIGLPVLSAILGAEAVLYAAIVLIPANVVLFSAGAMMFSAGDDSSPRARVRAVLSSLKSPTLIASVAVLAMALIGVSDLGVVGGSLSIVGQMTTPLALLITGASMARYRPIEMVGNPRAYVATMGRLVLVPAATIAAVALFPLDSYLRAVVVLDCSMPVATVGTLSACRAEPTPSP